MNCYKGRVSAQVLRVYRRELFPWKHEDYRECYIIIEVVHVVVLSHSIVNPVSSGSQTLSWLVNMFCFNLLLKWLAINSFLFSGSLPQFVSSSLPFPFPELVIPKSKPCSLVVQQSAVSEVIFDEWLCSSLVLFGDTNIICYPPRHRASRYKQAISASSL